MAVSKRLRFEILRRDNHACRYCGAKAPDTEIVVDHVVPVALGGTDEPSNLVAACVPCNTGKTSLPADASIVDDVGADALRWAKAMRFAADVMGVLSDARETCRKAFDDEWASWSYGVDKSPIPRPLDWPDTIERLRVAGLPIPEIVEAARVALRSRNVELDNTFRYFCGVAWKKVNAMQEIARDSLEADV